jgi:hypothetical protein
MNFACVASTMGKTWDQNLTEDEYNDMQQVA